MVLGTDIYLDFKCKLTVLDEKERKKQALSTIIIKTEQLCCTSLLPSSVKQANGG